MSSLKQQQNHVPAQEMKRDAAPRDVVGSSQKIDARLTGGHSGGHSGGLVEDDSGGGYGTGGQYGERMQQQRMQYGERGPVQYSGSSQDDEHRRTGTSSYTTPQNNIANLSGRSSSSRYHGDEHNDRERSGAIIDAMAKLSR